MKRSILSCLFFVVIVAVLWPNEQPKWAILLTSLKTERRILQRSINSIENELNTTKQALSDLRKEFSQMESASDDLRRLLNESKKAVEERLNELEKEKALSLEHKATSARLETQLTESDQSLTSLKLNFDGYQKQAENEIQGLELVAVIGIPVAIVVGVVIGVLIP